MTNWAEYKAGLRARGGLTVWFTSEAIAAEKQRVRRYLAGSNLYLKRVIGVYQNWGAVRVAQKFWDRASR